MKQVNYVLLLLTLIFAFSCDMQNDQELTGFEDENGDPWNPPSDDPIDGGEPIGGGGPIGGGDPPSDDPVIYDEVREISACISKYSLSTFEITGYGNNINWHIEEGNFDVVVRDGNRLTVFVGDNFTGGIIIATTSSFKATYTISECPAPPPCYPNYTAVILDEYIDGTSSGADIVYLNLSSTWPTGTTYEWEIIRQDGSSQHYGASTDMVRAVAASIDNPIKKAIIYVTYQGCERGLVTTFDPGIPQQGTTSSYLNVKGKDFVKTFKYHYSK